MDTGGTVNKLSESVENIERNLGLEDNLNVEEGAFFDPVMNLTRQKDVENDSVIQEAAQSSKNLHSEETLSRSSTESPAEIVSKDFASQPQEQDQTLETRDQDQQSFLSMQQDQNASTAFDQDEHLEQDQQLKEPEQDQHLSSSEDAQTEGRVQEISEVTLPSKGEEQEEPQYAEADHSEGFSAGDDLLKGLETVERVEEVVTAQTMGKAEPTYLQDVAQTGSPFQQAAENGPLVDEKIVNDSAVSSEPEPLNPSSATHDIKDDTAADANDSDELHMVNNYQVGDQATVPGSGILDRTPSAKAEQMEALIKKDVDVQQLHSESLVSQNSALSLIGESESEAEKRKADTKIKEAALQGAGKQAEVYVVRKERDTRRREQSRKKVTKKQAAQEAERRKLRAQVKEAKVESIKKDKAATEKALQDDVERSRAELAAQKEFYTNALNEAKEAEAQALAEARANTEAKTELEHRLREAGEREAALEELRETLSNKERQAASCEDRLRSEIDHLWTHYQAAEMRNQQLARRATNAAQLAWRATNAAVVQQISHWQLEHRLSEAGEREAALIQALEELRETLSNRERQAASCEDELRSEIDHLWTRFQAAEMRNQELASRDTNAAVLRQTSHWQNDLERREEELSLFRRQLYLRLEEAEVNTASAEERERAMNERLSRTLSRMSVLEAQVSAHRAEQAQLARSLEQERQRAAENRQEYLVARERAASHEGRANQLEEEMREIRNQHNREMVEEM